MVILPVIIRMPLESISRIEIVRGTGSLQYGAQFGGMLNYVTKQADTTKAFQFRKHQYGGSYNLLSTYNAIGGTSENSNTMLTINKKARDGYGENEHTESESQDVILEYEFHQIFLQE